MSDKARLCISKIPFSSVCRLQSMIFIRSEPSFGLLGGRLHGVLGKALRHNLIHPSYVQPLFWYTAQDAMYSLQYRIWSHHPICLPEFFSPQGKPIL